MKCLKQCILFLTICFLSGCWDDREMEDRSYIITMGIDQNENNGRYLLTLGTARFSDKEGEKEEKKDTQNTEKTITVTGDTLASAIRQADTYSSRQVYLGQLKTVILGKEVLKEKKLLKSLLDELERNQDISGKIILLGTEKTAKECVNAILEADASNGLFIWDFYKNTAQDVAVTRKLELETFLRELRSSDGNSILPRITTTEKGIKLGGGIVIEGYRLLDVLSDKQEQGVLLLQGEGKGAVIDGIWQNTAIPMWIYQNKSKFSFSEKNGDLICHVKISASGSAEGSSLESKSLFQANSIEELEKIFESIIKSEIENTIALAQKKYKKDIFDIATMLKKQNLSLYEKYGKQRQEMIQNMIFDVSVDVKIRTIGVVD